MPLNALRPHRRLHDDDTVIWPRARSSRSELSEYEAVGDWYRDAREEGLFVPVQLCHAVRKLMKREQTGFATAFTKLLNAEKHHHGRQGLYLQALSQLYGAPLKPHFIL